MVHAYKPKEVSSCLSNRRLVFVGDSTIRQVFWATAKKLDPKIEMKGDKHSDITVDLANVKLEFTWDPFLNGSVAIKELGLLDRKASNRPALMLMGTGLWYARFVPTNPLKQWKDSINGVVQYMDGRRSTDLTHQDFALLAPVPVPVWDKLNDDRRATIRPDTIAEMNEYMHELSDIHGIDVAWAFNKMTAGIPQVYENSGIHVLDSIAAKQAETLLNLRCNAELPPKYPYDRTCCNKYEAPNWQQWALLVSVLAVLPVLSYMRTKGM